jgi:putative phosphoribosyl transferase
MAGDALHHVQTPTLLIVGALDDVVIDLNRGAAEALQCHYQLTIVPGATHLFSEPGNWSKWPALPANGLANT